MEGGDPNVHSETLGSIDEELVMERGYGYCHSRLIIDTHTNTSIVDIKSKI